MFYWKWKAAANVVCIDVGVTPATDTCPIVSHRLCRGVLELDNEIMALGIGIAHRGAGESGAAVIARLSVNGRSRCRTVLDWP
jgi:hypothetical protein